jgi:hypothetical protein|tara:strand:+ start:156 stop:572 length:417 start_codon:yes stop_codon:yes gene_type:complete
MSITQKIEKKATYNDVTKVCSKCGIDQSIENFGRSSGAKYRRSECNSCNSLLNKVRRELKAITPPPPENHTCPICEKTADQVRGAGGKKSGHWCLDHDHKTHQFRGWICHTCNRAIGQLQDDIKVLENAIKYIAKGRE